MKKKICMFITGSVLMVLTNANAIQPARFHENPQHYFDGKKLVLECQPPNGACGPLIKIFDSPGYFHYQYTHEGYFTNVNCTYPMDYKYPLLGLVKNHRKDPDGSEAVEESRRLDGFNVVYGSFYGYGVYVSEKNNTVRAIKTFNGNLSEVLNCKKY